MFLICLPYLRIKKRPLRLKGISFCFCLLQSANQVQSSYHSRTVLNVSAIQITVFMWLKAKQTLYYCIEKLDLVKKSNSKERDSNGSRRRRRNKEITSTDPKRENIDINKRNEWKTKSNGFLWSPVDKRKILIYVLSLNIDRNTRARSNSPLSRVYIVERLDIADSFKYIQNNNNNNNKNENENAIFLLFRAINISDRYFYTILYFTWLFWHYISLCLCI